ncbi:hypothetical protein [Streptomyces sp. NPDC026673]|uniref:hypothetical protein n=1 Tax=Streptomyces sp. NPDC026673 TaxID=3155724 RepID=UPI0033F9C4E5
MHINSITARRVAAAALAAPILTFVGVGTAAAAPQQTATQSVVDHGGCWGYGCGYGGYGYGGYGYGPGFGYGPGYGYGYGPGYGNGVIVIFG